MKSNVSPTITYKAIYIERNKIHLVYEEQKEQELNEVIDHKEAFPF